MAASYGTGTRGAILEVVEDDIQVAEAILLDMGLHSKWVVLKRRRIALLTGMIDLVKKYQYYQIWIFPLDSYPYNRRCSCSLGYLTPAYFSPCRFALMITDVKHWEKQLGLSIADYQEFGFKHKTLEVLYDLNWFKSFIPTALGGRELDLWAGLDIIRRSSAVNGSLGWVINLGGGANFFWHYFDDAQSSQFFSPRKTVLAGSGRLGVLQKKGGQLLLSGNWANCSGSAHATHFTVSAASETGENFSFIIDRAKINIEKYWPFDALKTSSSFSISVDNIKVEDSAMFQIDKSKTTIDYPLRFLSFKNFAELSMLMSVYGMYEGLLYRIKEEKPSAFLQLGGDQLFTDLVENLQNLKLLSEEVWGKCQTAKVLVDQDLSFYIRESVEFISRTCVNITNVVGMDLWRKDGFVYLSWKDLMLGLQHSLLKMKK